MICENCFRNNTDTSGNVLHNIEIKERLTIGMHFGKALSPKELYKSYSEMLQRML